MAAASNNLKVGYARLGNSGLKISKIILGFMTYNAGPVSSGWNGGWTLPQPIATAHVKAALELGINTFDTADTYSDGSSEVALGIALKELQVPREEVVILTKVHFTVTREKEPIAGYVNLRGNSRKHIFDGIKDSLKRLDLEYVDLLQLHRFDPETPIEETMDALHDVVKLGYARYIGMSSCYAYQFAAMQNYAKGKGQTCFISMQNFYNPIYREEEREMMPTLELLGASSIPWSPLARGFLTRPLSEINSTARSGKDPYVSYMSGTGAEKNMSEDVNRAVEKLANEKGVSMAQITVAWILSNKTVAAPIVGTTRVESLKELVEGTKIELSKEEIESISKPYTPRNIAGH